MSTLSDSRRIKCLLCHRKSTSEKLTKCKTLSTLEPLLTEAESNKIKASNGDRLYYHKACYMKKRRSLLVCDDGVSDTLHFSLKKKTRTSYQVNFNNSLCVFCQKNTKSKGCLMRFSTVLAQRKVEHCLARHKDKTICDRLRDVDLIAGEVKYHKKCYLAFTRGSEQSLQETTSSATTDEPDCLDITYSHFQESIKAGKVITSTAFLTYYHMRDPERRSFNVLRALSNRYGTEIKILDATPTEKIIFQKELSILDILNAKKEDNEILECAANILSRDIKDAWKPLDTYNVGTELVNSLIPDTLNFFLDLLDASAGSASRICSIAQDLIALVTKRVTPKQITTASTVKHLTGSKLLINQLNSLGHSASYTELQRFETAAALTELAVAAENDVIIPANIKDSDYGFIQAAADNDDFCEDSKDGKKTTHATTMVLYKTRLHGSFANIDYPRALNKTRRRTINEADYKNLLNLKMISVSKQIIIPDYSNKEAVNTLTSREFTKQSVELAQAYIHNISWLLARLVPVKLFELDINPSSQLCPSWSAYNNRLSNPPDHVSVVGYCPMLNAVSTDPSTVYTVLKQLNQIMVVLKQKHSIITFDLAIYRVAKIVQWSRPIEFQNTIIRLGGFHIITNFLGALGTMHKTSGLKQVIASAEVFSDVTTSHIMAGKHYNRGVRLHKLVYEAISRKKILAFSDWLVESGKEDVLDEMNVTDTEDLESGEMMKAATIIAPLMSEFESYINNSSPMGHFWNNYIKSVETLLALIRSERSSNWTLYIDSLIAMLPVFFAYERTNYARWLPIYILDMLDLEQNAPEVHHEFAAGKFSINRTGNSFSGMPTDQVLEQTMNKESKGAGGLIGITRDADARTKWFLTSHVRAHLYSAQKEMCEKTTDGSRIAKHKEDSHSMTAKDEADIQCLLNTLQQSNVNMFTGNAELLNIATGAKPDAESTRHILSALSEGSERAKKFIDECINQRSKPFDATLPKQKVPAFDVVGKANLPTLGKKKSKRVPLAKLLILGQGRELNIRQILDYETTDIPLALFDAKGNMRKTTKAQLTHELEHYLSEGNQPDVQCDSKALIIDGMSLVQVVKGSGKFGDYSQLLLEKILSEGVGYQRIDVVFDVYDPDSLKSAERARRGEQKMCDIRINNGDIRIPSNWNVFLSNINNKNALVSFLIVSWVDLQTKIPEGTSLIVSGRDALKLTKDEHVIYESLQSNHDEADTRLLLHAADAMTSHDLVVVRSVDTDVLVLAVHHHRDIMNGKDNKDLVMHVGMGSKKRYISVSNLVSNLPSQVVKNILPLHALTGCDTVSAIFRCSKKKALDTMKTVQLDLTALGEQPLVSTGPVFKSCESFIARMYGDFTDITEARYRLFATKNIDREEQLPPSRNALTYHIQRSGYQVMVWKNALNRTVNLPSPTGNGWDDTLRPVLCDESPAIKEITSCGCKKSECSKDSCRCFKLGMTCTDACTCLNCQNRQSQSEDEESSISSSDES